MKMRQFMKSTLALLLVLASLLSVLPAAFATEAEESEQITINSSDLIPAESEEEMEREEYEAMEEELQNQMAQQLAEEYGLDMDEPEVTSKNDEDTEFGYLTYDELVAAGLNPEDFGYKGATRDIINSTTPAYIFLDFKVGSASRAWNWQYKSDDGTVPYHSANIQGAIAADYKGTDPRLYMPIETDEDYINARLKSYKIKSGDIARVYINAINENSQFVKDGTKTADSYFAVHTSDSPGEWVGFASAHAKITFKSGSQTLTWNVSNSRVGDTLHAIRWDPSQTELTDSARIYVDYIYIGPSSTAPVLCQFRNEANDANLSGGGGYIGYGKKAPAFSTGKVNSEDSTTQTIWGWTVWHQINGTWTNQNKFVTDPSTVTLNYNTRFVLTQVKIRKQTLNSTQTYNNGSSTEDDKYVLEVDGFDTAEMNLGGYGTPLDIAIILDRSGSEGDLVWKKNFGKGKKADITTYLETLSKHVDDGYYRATCFRKKKHNGTNNAFTGGYLFTMPMRYHNGDWQMQYVWDCTCNGGYYGDYGIYQWNATGLNQCSHVKWKTVEECYDKFVSDASTTGYTIGTSYTIKGVKETLYFTMGASRMGKIQGAVENFLIDLYNSTPNLKPGTKHRVSVISFGNSVYAENYPYYCADESQGKDGFVTAGNVSGLTIPNTTLDYDTYETVLKCINQTYILGSTRTDTAFQVLSGELSEFETKAGKTKQVLKSTNYLPAATTGRKRVVIFLTDGKPAQSYDFTRSVANDAIAASYVLKNDGVIVYSIGVMDGLNSDYSKLYNQRKTLSDGTTESVASMEARTTEIQKMNDFMFCISSHYKNAKVYYTTASRTTTKKYFFHDTSGGDKIADQLASIWNDNAASLKVSGKSGPASLWLYEDYGREWKPDTASDAYVKIYAAPYTGNGTYGAKVQIGQHKVTDNTKDQSFTGNGYILHYYYDESDQSFTYALQWKDAKTAFLRETELSTGSAAKAMSGTLNTKKGYKIFMEMPIEVDRNNTLGGNNIPLTTSTSGCYQAKDTSDTAIGTKLYNYVQPNANVSCSVESEGHDYFVSLENYIAMLSGTGSVTAEDILADMIRMPENLRPANDHGVSNLKYMSFDVQIKDPQNTVIYHMAAEQNEVTLKTNVYEMDQLSADLTKDQIFTMSADMKYSTHNVDSYGRQPYQDINDTFNPTYYVPKFAVVDFGDDISVPMGLEGERQSNITGLTGGTLSGTGADVKMKLAYNNTVLDEPEVMATYTYTTENRPKGAESNDVPREVYMIPANVVTYDDTALTPGPVKTDSSTTTFTSKVKDANGVYKTKSRTVDTEFKAWTATDGHTSIAQTYSNEMIHGGYDANYATGGDFHGSTMMVSVGETKNYDADGDMIYREIETAHTSFTFTGTGFEILSRTASDSGVIVAEVFAGTEIVESALIKSILCNTYLAGGNYKQVPVIRWDCDVNKDGVADYGTYTVRLVAYYNAAFALRSTKDALSEAEVKAMLGYGEGVDFTYIPSESVRDSRAITSSYNVYIDGFRVFNPVESSALVDAVYSLSGESAGVTFTDMQNKVLDSDNWKGTADQATGMLYLADQSESTDSDDTTSSATDGFPLFMDGSIATQVGDRTYYVGEDGKRITDPKTGKEIFSMYFYNDQGQKAGYYYVCENPDGTAEKPYLFFSRAYVRQLLGDAGVFYSAKYKALGAKTEAQLASGQGVAFVANGEKVMVSVRSLDGGSCTLEAYKEAEGETPAGFVPVVSGITSATETFYDLTDYVDAQGGLILKNNGTGILSIVHVKTAGEKADATEASIYVTNELAYKAALAFETPIAEQKLEGLKIGHSLNLQSNISINYVVSKAALADFDNYLMTSEVAGKTYTMFGEEKGEYVYFTLDCLTAAMMNDNVRTVLTAYKGEEVYVSEADDYSIAAYCFTMMNKDSATETFKSLCANLLRYGAATQTYLGYNTDALADEELTAEQRAYLIDLSTVTFGDPYTLDADIAEPTVMWKGRTLVLDSTVAVKFVVDASAFAGDPMDLELQVSYTGIDGEEKAFTVGSQVYNADMNLYVFTVEQLNAAELRSRLHCQIFANGEAVSQTMHYTADSYGNGKTGALLDLCKALFAYVDEAKAFFG